MALAYLSANLLLKHDDAQTRGRQGPARGACAMAGITKPPGLEAVCEPHSSARRFGCLTRAAQSHIPGACQGIRRSVNVSGLFSTGGRQKPMLLHAMYVIRTLIGAPSSPAATAIGSRKVTGPSG